MKLNWKLFAPLVVAIIVWLIGAPEGLSANSWIYVSIFAGLVVGLILEPMPPAFIGIIAVTVSMLFKVGPAPVVDKATGVAKAITDAQAISWGLSGFSNAIVWLIFAAFMIGIGYENSGLGRRIALFLVAKLGKSSLGLGYAIAITDLVLAPFIPSVFCKPEVKGSPEIAAWAKDEYKKLGSMTRSEIFMALISVLALVLWIGASTFKVNPTTTALIVIILMIFTKIMTWQDFLANKPAWNVLTWFATLVPMAAGLKNVGFLDWLAKSAGGSLVSLDPTMAVLGLLLAFCLLRYFFASGTAYVTAMVGLFATLILQIPGVDPAQVMLILLVPMGIMGILTPYGTGHSPIWFASGYNKGPEFWKLGAIFGIIYLAIFIVVGIPWIQFVMPLLG